MQVLKLANQATKEADETGRPSHPPPPCYFSGYLEYDGSNYFDYWLDAGEEKTFQVGWCLNTIFRQSRIGTVTLSDTQGLALYIGLEDGFNGNGIPLTP